MASSESYRREIYEIYVKKLRPKREGARRSLRWADTLSSSCDTSPKMDAKLPTEGLTKLRDAMLWINIASDFLGSGTKFKLLSCSQRYLMVNQIESRVCWWHSVNQYDVRGKTMVSIACVAHSSSCYSTYRSTGMTVTEPVWLCYTSDHEANKLYWWCPVMMTHKKTWSLLDTVAPDLRLKPQNNLEAMTTNSTPVGKL